MESRTTGNSSSGTLRHTFASLHENPILGRDGSHLFSFRSSHILREGDQDKVRATVYETQQPDMKIRVITSAPDEQHLAIGISWRISTSEPSQRRSDLLESGITNGRSSVARPKQASPATANYERRQSLDRCLGIAI